MRQLTVPKVAVKVEADARGNICSSRWYRWTLLSLDFPVGLLNCCIRREYQPLWSANAARKKNTLQTSFQKTEAYHAAVRNIFTVRLCNQYLGKHPFSTSQSGGSNWLSQKEKDQKGSTFNPTTKQTCTHWIQFIQEGAYHVLKQLSVWTKNLEVRDHPIGRRPWWTWLPQKDGRLVNKKQLNVCSCFLPTRWRAKHVRSFF